MKQIPSPAAAGCFIIFSSSEFANELCMLAVISFLYEHHIYSRTELRYHLSYSKELHLNCLNPSGHTSQGLRSSYAVAISLIMYGQSDENNVLVKIQLDLFNSCLKGRSLQ